MAIIYPLTSKGNEPGYLNHPAIDMQLMWHGVDAFAMVKTAKYALEEIAKGNLSSDDPNSISNFKAMMHIRIPYTHLSNGEEWQRSGLRSSLNRLVDMSGAQIPAQAYAIIDGKGNDRMLELYGDNGVNRLSYLADLGEKRPLPSDFKEFSSKKWSSRDLGDKETWELALDYAKLTWFASLQAYNADKGGILEGRFDKRYNPVPKLSPAGQKYAQRFIADLSDNMGIENPFVPKSSRFFERENQMRE